jgi:hypothetical protein
MWEEAAPIPASKQKPLFDETTQAEKVRNFIEIFLTVSGTTLLRHNTCI